MVKITEKSPTAPETQADPGRLQETEVPLLQSTIKAPTGSEGRSPPEVGDLIQIVLNNDVL